VFVFGSRMTVYEAHLYKCICNMCFCFNHAGDVDEALRGWWVVLVYLNRSEVPSIGIDDSAYGSNVIQE
jgi:hypothetical protein